MYDFLRLYGASEAYGNTYVLVDEENDIIAYYTIRPDPIELADEFKEGESITYIVLERLAVAKNYQIQGVGKWILSTVINQILAASLSFQIDALVLMPLDEDAKGYYLNLNAGFEELTDGSDLLALAVDSMKKM